MNLKIKNTLWFPMPKPVVSALRKLFVPSLKAAPETIQKAARVATIPKEQLLISKSGRSHIRANAESQGTCSTCANLIGPVRTGQAMTRNGFFNSTTRPTNRNEI